MNHGAVQHLLGATVKTLHRSKRHKYRDQLGVINAPEVYFLSIELIIRRGLRAADYNV